MGSVTGSEAGGKLEDCEKEGNADYNAGGYCPVYARVEDLNLRTVTFLEAGDLNRRNQQKALTGAKVQPLLKV